MILGELKGGNTIEDVTFVIRCVSFAILVIPFLSVTKGYYTPIQGVNLYDNDDPDSFILKHGKERFEGLIKNAINYSDFKLKRLRDKVDFRSDEGKANYINRVIEETSKLDDSIRREVVLKRLAKEFDISYNTLEMRMNSLLKDEKKKDEVVIPKKETTKKDKYTKAFEQIIYFMLNNDWVITEVEEGKLIFPSNVMRKTCSEISYYYKKYGEINVADFYTSIQDKEDKSFCYCVSGTNWIYKSNSQITRASTGEENTVRKIIWE